MMKISCLIRLWTYGRYFFKITICTDDKLRYRQVWMLLCVVTISALILTSVPSIFKAVVHEHNTMYHFDVVTIAKNIHKHSNVVLVAVINDAYLPLAYSWLCNTREMGIHNKTLFITTDEQTRLKLKRDWPELSVANMNNSNLKGDREYGQVGYLRFNVRRHEEIYRLLKAGIEILHFEVDCVWLKNPLPYLQSHAGFDLLVNAVSYSKEFASGFVYINKTEKSIRTWQLLVERMMDLDRNVSGLKDNSKVKVSQNDQPFFSDIVHNRIPGVKIKVLPLDKFADGKWYEMKEAQRNSMQPFIINNNWISGNKNKIARAKKWNHWFLDEHMKCKMDLVYKIVKS